MTRPAIDPRRTALLVMDYQAGILGRLGDAEPLLSRAADAIAVVRGRGGQIGYVRVAFDDADYDAVPPHSRFASVGPAMHSDSPATAVHDAVAPETPAPTLRPACTNSSPRKSSPGRHT